jgi:hypothetical protein
MNKVFRSNDLEVKQGNKKIGVDTLIFNMGPAIGCPSDMLGFCSCSKVCYAKKAERMYPNVSRYRKKQERYWLNTNAYEFIVAFETIFIKHKRALSKIKYFRFNESGDFHSQECVDKLDIISRYLKMKGIVTYGYTARKDLDFSNVTFLVKGSDNDAGNNGKTTIIKSVKDRPKGFCICPADCSICPVCKTYNKKNVAFILH